MEIQELLQSFRKLKFPPDRFELIIVDDGSTDGTDEVINEYIPQVSFSLRFLRQENKGPSAARNLGMENAKGDFIIFTDSDCTLDPEWLNAIDRSLNKYRADAFGGPDAGRDDFPPLLKAINYSMTSFLTTGGIRGHKKKKLGKFYPRSFNMGLSRALYHKIGGFPPLLYGEDIEFSHRILKSGAKVIQIPDAIVYHKRRTSIRKFFLQLFKWGVARVNLFKLDSTMLEPIHTLPAIATFILILLIIGSIFFKIFRSALLLFLVISILGLIISGIHASIKHREWRLFFLVPIIIPIQIFGYGLGFLYSFIIRVILKKWEFKGFKKKYYANYE